MVAVFSSHGYWSTIDFTVDTIYTRVFFVEASSITTWEFCMGVARYNSIYTWQAGDLIAFIFLAFFILVIPDTGVRKYQGDVCTCFAHLRDDVSNSLDRIANDDFSFKISLVPVENLRRNNPSHTYFDSRQAALRIRKGLFDDFVRLIDEFTSCWIQHVGIDKRHACCLNHAVQIV